jgi:uncharacterized protein (TIGR02646 family)
MNPIVRAAAPLCLSKDGRFKKKCKKWEVRYAANPNSQFAWGKYQKQKVVDLIIDALTPMTQKHCAFCDISKVIKGGVRPTIEHYVPKSVKPLLAYVWSNLFLCCHQCQEYKNNLFHKELIKPDRVTYNFDEYFIIDFATGELQPNPAFPQNITAAQQTILLYGLNEDGRPQLRLDEVEAYNNTVPVAQILDNFSYRFFISRS